MLNCKTGLIFTLFTIFFLHFTFVLSAQTAAELETLLNTQAVTAAEAARFVLGAAELLQAELYSEHTPAVQAAAYSIAAERGWIKKNADETVTLKDTAYLVMKAFEFKGGIMTSGIINTADDTAQIMQPASPAETKAEVITIITF